MYKDFDNYSTEFFGTADRFGGSGQNEKKKYVERNNVKNPFPDDGAYFGCISEGEELTGVYSDLSIVVFPSNEADYKNDRWMVSLVVGSLGFKNDYDIVTLPGIKRRFASCLTDLPDIVPAFIKHDFVDIESQDGFTSYCAANNIPESLGRAVKRYSKVILCASIINPNNKNHFYTVVNIYMGLYAIIRHWPTNNKTREEVNKAIHVKAKAHDEEQEIKKLLDQRKYLVLQGAPGTGKTRMAKRIAESCSNIFFTQFHAETSYSDFVYGILPDSHYQRLRYKENAGVFVRAIKAALNNKNEKVYLIIDEINRANLSNVLGPAFYLFEPTMSGSGVKVELCPGFSIDKLPENLYVIATMNTADRSLALVDFALRRRFAWYTMIPHTIQADEGYVFCEKHFNAIRDIFEEYATDEELNLQPGQAYFVVSSADAESRIQMRLKYELMPLIKEYLANGLLTRAKDDFINYFRNEINEEMYR